MGSPSSQEEDGAVSSMQMLNYHLATNFQHLDRMIETLDKKVISHHLRHYSMASIYIIANQQFKTNASFLQTHSDVKMVGALVALEGMRHSSG